MVYTLYLGYSLFIQWGRIQWGHSVRLVNKKPKHPIKWNEDMVVLDWVFKGTWIWVWGKIFCYLMGRILCLIIFHCYIINCPQLIHYLKNMQIKIETKMQFHRWKSLTILINFRNLNYRPWLQNLFTIETWFISFTNECSEKMYRITK